MKNVRYITWLLLWILFSQQALASVSTVIAISHSSESPSAQDEHSVCAQHHHNHSLQSYPHCESKNIRLSYSVKPTAMIMLSSHHTSDNNKAEHGTHCDNCLSACQPLVFFSSAFHMSMIAITIEITDSSLFIPAVPPHVFFRPPIDV
jgi:hypothetical protein